MVETALRDFIDLGKGMEGKGMRNLWSDGLAKMCVMRRIDGGEYG